MKNTHIAAQCRTLANEFDSPGFCKETDEITATLRQAAQALEAAELEMGEAIHPNHRSDLRYILKTLERATPALKHDKALHEQVQASITGMRYVIDRTESAATPSTPQTEKKPLSDEQVQIAFRKGIGAWMTPGTAFAAGVRSAERAHGIVTKESTNG